jgi:hypothetical protein
LLVSSEQRGRDYAVRRLGHGDRGMALPCDWVYHPTCGEHLSSDLSDF